MKPLGRKAYGSIPHLPGSRLGPGDHSCHAGQAEIALRKVRDRHDVITVTEKLDGSCCAIARIGDAIHALGRAGFPAETSPHRQHVLFAEWVREREIELINALPDGTRLVGEWMIQAHGTRYLIDDPRLLFVPFDLMVDGRRLPQQQMRDVAERAGLTPAPIVGIGPMTVEQAEAAPHDQRWRPIDGREGFVWRVERKGEADFLAKFVRRDKQDGLYLPELTGAQAVWNYPVGEMA